MVWQLAHETHAIERVTVTFNFSEAMPTKPWLSVLALAAGKLPEEGFYAAPDSPEPAQGPAGGPFVAQFVINLSGAQFGGAQNAGGVPAARIFQRIIAGEAQEQITLHRNQISFTTSHYAGWADFSSNISDLIFPYLERAIETISVNVVKMEYWDRFVFDGLPDEADYSDLLNDHSKYVPSFVLKERGLWHSHIGFFSEPGTSERRLVNLNLDVIDIGEPADPEAAPGALVPRRSVGIYSMAQDSIREGSSDQSCDALGSTLDEMHTILKRLLGEAITPATADRISLNPQPQA